LPVEFIDTVAAFDKIVVEIAAGTEEGVLSAAVLLKGLASEYTPMASGALAASEEVVSGVESGGPNPLRVVNIASAAGIFAASIGPGAGGHASAYARRIELGFHGTDKLGRTYHQSGRAYLWRANRDIEHLFEGLIENVWRAKLTV
jgi:hypothetical protein